MTYNIADFGPKLLPIPTKRRNFTKRINDYVARAMRDPYVPIFDLEEEGLYGAIGACWGGDTLTSASGKYFIGKTYEGTFKEAIRFFTDEKKVDGFYNEYCVGDPGNINNGYIIKIRELEGIVKEAA